MNNRDEVKIPIKVVTNKEKTKVLFVEAGPDFVDVLQSLLHLPLGKIIEVLKKSYGYQTPIIGSLSTLYDGIANLEVDHFVSELAKQKILHPLSSRYDNESRQLRLDINAPRFVGPQSYLQAGDSFIITDDLRVMPNVSHSLMRTIDNLGLSFAEMIGAEKNDVAFGFTELVCLLWALMVFENPLTVLFCGSRMGKEVALSNRMDDGNLPADREVMTLRIVVQKSSKKFLFAQANSNFINFLCGLLNIPLERLELWLKSRSGLKALDNLYKSKSTDSKAVDKKNRDLIKSLRDLNFDEHPTKHVKESRMFMVTDSLTITPLGLSSFISILDSHNIPADDVEELDVEVKLLNGLHIMIEALKSTTALTDGFIKQAIENVVRVSVS